MNKIIDGKAFAEGLRGRIAQQIAGLKAKHDLVPGLAVVLVGEDPASQVYVASKSRTAKECGFHSLQHTLPESSARVEQLWPEVRFAIGVHPHQAHQFAADPG